MLRMWPYIVQSNINKACYQLHKPHSLITTDNVIHNTKIYCPSVCAVNIEIINFYSLIFRSSYTKDDVNLLIWTAWPAQTRRWFYSFHGTNTNCYKTLFVISVAIPSLSLHLTSGGKCHPNRRLMAGH